MHAKLLCDEWVRVGLSTELADRNRAEAAIAELYGLIGEPDPEFVWVPSPLAAMEVLRSDPDRPRHVDTDTLRQPFRQWPMCHRLVSIRSNLVYRLRRHVLGLGWGDIFRDLYQELEETLRDRLYRRLQSGLPAGDVVGLEMWDIWRVACLDIFDALGLLKCHRKYQDQLALWAVVARSAGWWWPGDHRCVIAERPAAFHVDVPESGLRLRYYPDGPAAEFRDGTSIFVGTVAWIETHREPEECWAAIEHLGWEAFIAEAHAKHIASAPDPGNPGAQLHLYQLPQEDLRILVVTNGSQERDGTRRCYGLPVPHFIDPVAAAAWTYGLDRHRYAQLVRRT